MKCKSRSCFYRLFMSGQENHWKSYDLEKNLKTIGRVTSFDFCSKLVTGNRFPNPCNWLHKAFYERMWLFTIDFEFQRSYTLVIDYQINVIDYTKLLCERMWLFTNEFEFQRSNTLVIDYQYLVIDYTIWKSIGTL